MPEHLRLFLDQMLRREVAEALRNDGHDVVRTSDVGQARTHTDDPGGALVRGMTKPEELRIFFRVFVLS